ncbi:AfsR/SARP family transcriptional regulator [Streptomyces sp. NPDC005925]|uniref:AfsR/SARP family transcriptional regulator n=1 Tax=Streptomyces sp. NPDC005925 TaxID=3157172 RepID=UPI0033ED00F9
MGLLSISDGDQVAVLQPSRPTSLLAALLIHSGTTVSTDYLLRAVWDTEPPATARAALQSCVLRLRRIFAKYGIANDTIEAVPGGYRMRMNRDTLDLLHFRELVRTAAAAPGIDTEVCVLREALALWHGPVLANVSSQRLHRDEAPRLTEQRLRVLERLCDIELARGRCHEVLAEVWDAARQHPERERFSEQLIEALYRTGRQTEALVQIRDVKERLKEEFGIDPGAPLQRLEMAILRGEALDIPADRTAVRAIEGRVAPPKALPASAPPAPPADPAGGESVRPDAAPLPPSAARPPVFATPSAAAATSVSASAPVPGFTGRVPQLAAMRRALTAEGAGTGLVVLSGAPGIGKTALALQAAHLTRDAFPGGSCVLALTGPQGEPLGTAEEPIAVPPPAGPGRRLIVLDDAVSAEQVRPLLPPSADGVAVVTSRRGLAGLVATHGGTVHRLDTFDEEESHQFLVAALGAERVAAEPDASCRLAAICGHFPLALRIATARLLTRPDLGIGEGVDWLADDLPDRLALADEPRMSVPRVFDAALRRLDPDLRAAFLLLAARGRNADGPPPPPPDEVLERLADAGFIEEGPPKPYRIHELLHVYARRHRAALPPARLRPATGPARPGTELVPD